MLYRGEEVFINYGHFPNLELLCDYGFVSTGSNPFNFECVTVNIIRMEPVKIMINPNDGSLDSGSLAVLRSYLTPSEQVEQILAKDNDLSMNTLFMKPISDSIEEDVYSLIASFVDEAIYNSKRGVEWALENNEYMIEKYLTARVQVLEKGLDYMKEKFTDLLF